MHSVDDSIVESWFFWLSGRKKNVRKNFFPCRQCDVSKSIYRYSYICKQNHMKRNKLLNFRLHAINIYIWWSFLVCCTFRWIHSFFIICLVNAFVWAASQQSRIFFWGLEWTIIVWFIPKLQHSMPFTPSTGQRVENICLECEETAIVHHPEGCFECNQISNIR